MFLGKYKYRLTESWVGMDGYNIFQTNSNDLGKLIADFYEYQNIGECTSHKISILDYRYKIIKEFDKDKVIK